MMVDRRHPEESVAGELKAEHLQDDGERLDDKDAPYDEEEKFLLGADGDDAEHATDGESPGVAHENAGWMAVKPKEAHACPDQRHTENAQLACLLVERDLEVGRHLGVTRHIGEDRVGKGRGDRAAGCEAIKAIGQVHCVGGADHDEGKEEERKPPEVLNQRLLIERDKELAGLHFGSGVQKEKRGDDAGEGELPEQLVPARQAGRLLFGDLQVVIHKAERAEPEHRKEREPDKLVGRPSPEDGGDGHGTEQEHAPHGRGTALAAVQLGQLMDLFFGADRLPHFQRDKPTDHPVAKDEAKQERGHRRAHGPEGDVLEDVERFEVTAEVLKIIEH